MIFSTLLIYIKFARLLKNFLIKEGDFMCASRVQRLLTAIMLGIILYFFAQAAIDFQNEVKESTNFMIATALQSFVILMMIIWAITNFCPSTWMMKKILPPCPWDCECEEDKK